MAKNDHLLLRIKLHLEGNKRNKKTSKIGRKNRTSCSKLFRKS